MKKRINKAKSFIKKYGLALLGEAPVDPFVRFKPDYIFAQFLHRGLNINPRQFPNRRKYLLSDIAITNKEMLKACAEIPNCKKIKSIDDIPTEDIKDGIFYVYFECDSDALYHVQKIIQHGGTYFPPLIFGNTKYRFTNRTAFDVLKQTWKKNDALSHLSIDIHENLCEALELTKHLEGDFVEIGVYLGGSAFTALNYLRAIKTPRKAWLLDTYNGFDYPEATSSSDGIWKGTHKLFGAKETMARISDVLGETKQDFTLVESNICEQELPKEITRIAVANIDVDIYDATKDAIRKVAPYMIKGGIMICEDATSTPGLYGAAVAMHEFLQTEEGRKFMPIFKGGQYFLIKLS